MRHWTTKYQMRFFIAVLQLSIILCYDTLKILKSGLDRGPIIIFTKSKGDKYISFDAVLLFMCLRTKITW